MITGRAGRAAYDRKVLLAMAQCVSCALGAFIAIDARDSKPPAKKFSLSLASENDADSCRRLRAPACDERRGRFTLLSSPSEFHIATTSAYRRRDSVAPDRRGVIVFMTRTEIDRVN